ncbi:MAG: DUF1287 domain-containing protein [Erysipelotrichaceae bacterium]|nr:DUF1287 domain-containing protein [Erysipelotrichaceae bacterium]MBR3694535.1 DUF1287 domain-containing protein [Erysipelotrichales bacterium]
MKLIRKVLKLVVLTGLVFGLYLADHYNLFPQRYYTNEELGIDTILSHHDFNENGVDDSLDLLLGARADALQHPTYDDAYYEGGFPPSDIGVCTDVIWRAFREAGYDLREMVDLDIRNRSDAYEIEIRDKNIDFRRVTNLRVFLDTYAYHLTTNPEYTSQWQPGDIVIFGDNTHIGIVSDRRTKDGRVYIIHNGGQPIREEDYLKRAKVSAHYRFNATLLPDEYLIRWSE